MQTPDINKYILSEYRDGGRGEIENGFPQYDCWGLVREIRHTIYSFPLMPEWGLVDPKNKREVTTAWHEAEALLKASESITGAIACVFHGNVLLHVGVVTEGRTGLCVLDTSPKCGPRLQSISAFQNEHNKNRMQVRYYT